MTDTCKDCRFVAVTIDNPNHPYFEKTHYWCRRYPPSIQSKNKGVYFTPVDPESWCGEFQSIVPKLTEGSIAKLIETGNQLLDTIDVYDTERKLLFSHHPHVHAFSNTIDQITKETSDD